VARNLEFVLEARGTPRGERSGRMHDAISAAGFPTALLGRRPGELSGGERQRAALARALVQEPRPLLLDEPRTGLDRDRRAHVIATLRRLRVEHGLSMLLVTHDQGEAFALADHVAVVHAGRVSQYGTPEDVYRRPDSRRVAEFVGTASFLPVRRQDGQLQTALGRFPEAGTPDGPQIAVFRPEDVLFDDASDLRGDVRDTYFQGDHWMHTVAVASGDVFVRATTPVDAGASVGLRATRVAFVPADDGRAQ
jgi:ABC-type Fe3+/spermidine/putrescine transport system ATPase subunit